MADLTDVDPRYFTPSVVPSPVGDLFLEDGIPTQTSAESVYDHLLYVHGLSAFLSTFRQASVHRLIEGVREFGVADGDVLIFSELMDSASLFLTANCDTVYFFVTIDLSAGPVVMDVPGGCIVVIDDTRFEWVGDAGRPGPDRGLGGSYLLVGPEYTGPLPEGGYFIYHSQLPTIIACGRAFIEGDDSTSAVARIKSELRISPFVAGGYGFSVSQFVIGNGPLAQLAEPRVPNYVEGSHQPVNTLVPEGFEFFELIDRIVQTDPIGTFSPDVAGLLHSIGIRKGSPFNPTARQRETLSRAVAVGSAAARAIAARPDPDFKFEYYEDSATWTNLLFQSGFDMTRPPATIDQTGVHLAARTDALNLAAWTGMFYIATLITPAMAMKMPGVGSQYLLAFLDSEGEALSGDYRYDVTLPAGIPAEAFWSFTLYDNQTRSMLVTDQKYPRAGSQNYPSPAAEIDEDGSTTITFSATRPEEVKAGNWVQTTPGRGFFLLLRLYSPTLPFFDKTWRVGEIIKAG